MKPSTLTLALHAARLSAWKSTTGRPHHRHLLTPLPTRYPVADSRRALQQEKIVDFLSSLRDFNDSFPGFATRARPGGRRSAGGDKRYYVDCVKTRGLIQAMAGETGLISAAGFLNPQ